MDLENIGTSVFKHINVFEIVTTLEKTFVLTEACIGNRGFELIIRKFAIPNFERRPS